MMLVTIKASIDNQHRVAFKDEDSKLKTYWKDAADVEVHFVCGCTSS